MYERYRSYAECVVSHAGTHVRITRTSLVLVVLCAAVVACGGGGSDTSESASSRTTTASPNVSADSAADSGAARDAGRNVDSIVAAIRACPRDGTWHACSLERRLQMSGFRTVRADSMVRIPGVSNDATLFLLGRQSLHVVFFESTSAADDAMRTLDSARAAPRGDTAVVWPDRPTLIRSANALAVLVGGSDRTVERVANAITAGPPQPERTTP